MGYVYELLLWTLFFLNCRQKRYRIRSFLHIGAISMVIDVGIMLYGISHSLPDITYQFVYGNVIGYILFVAWALVL